MTIIIFLVDTSASMNQRTYLGTTLLDVTKGAVETFMKIRSRDPASRMDRYMLLTFEEPPGNVKAGWKESHATFMMELKNLQAEGLTSMGPALKHTFDLLNVNRMQSGIDTYGQGRYPFYLEPAVIICISDGRHLTSSGSVQQELNLPMNNQVPGSELTKEPFRWDQRLFGLVLRMPAVPPMESPVPFVPAAEDSPIDVMCDVTGGRSYMVSSQRTLIQCLESLVQKVMSGVVINLEKIGPDPPAVEGEKEVNGLKEIDLNRPDSLSLPGEIKRANTPTFSSTAWHNCRKLIYVQRSAQKGHSVGFWPIPEAFWPDLSSPSLPPRSAHPVVKFSCTPCDPQVVENMPFDKYELEPSPLTQYILERRQPNTAWQVFVTNSAKYSDIGHPFGYVKASTNLGSVNLFVMPYNYPSLLPLLDELFKVHKLKPTQKWRQQFENYLKTMPVYYAQPLKRALSRMGCANLVPDQMDNCLSYSVVSYLKKLKNQAKMEYDRLVASVGQKPLPHDGIKVTSRSATSILRRKDFKQLLASSGGDMSFLKQELTEYSTFNMAVPDKDLKPQTYKNPFDISRKSLLAQITRMRANFLQPTILGTRLQDEDHVHSVPVQQMGNYQEYLKKMPSPLRELETQPVRQHMFGNPFKVNKNIMIDEADEAMPGQQTSRKRQSESPPPSPGPRKRKPGPLPKDFKRPVTPPIDTLQQMAAQNAGIIHVPGKSKGQPPPGAKPPDISVFGGENDIELDLNHLDSMLADPLSNHMQFSHQEALPVPCPVTLDEEEEENGELVICMEDEEAEEIEHNHVINNKKLTVMKEHNRLLRDEARKLVKRPGKNYDALFSQLNAVQGNLEMRRSVIRDIINEALRFKKKTLAQMLDQFEQSMVRAEGKNNLNNNKNHSHDGIVNNLNNIQKSPSR